MQASWRWRGRCNAGPPAQGGPWLMGAGVAVPIKRTDRRLKAGLVPIARPCHSLRLPGERQEQWAPAAAAGGAIARGARQSARLCAGRGVQRADDEHGIASATAEGAAREQGGSGSPPAAVLCQRLRGRSRRQGLGAAGGRACCSGTASPAGALPARPRACAAPACALQRPPQPAALHLPAVQADRCRAGRLPAAEENTLHHSLCTCGTIGARALPAPLAAGSRQ
jgi:hypothetical protein